MGEETDARNEVSIRKVGMYEETDITLKSKSDSIDELIRKAREALK